jgi:hypothetical protein
MNVDLTEEYSKMVQYIKKRVRNNIWCGINAILIKEAYRKSKGPYRLEAALMYNKYTSRNVNL